MKARVCMWAAVAAAAGLARADTIYRTGGAKPLEGVAIESATWVELRYRMPNIPTAQRIRSREVERFERTDAPRELARGREALQRGRFQEAVTQLRKGAEGGTPFASECAYLLGRAYLEWGAEDASKLAEAVAAFKAVVEKYTPSKDWFAPAAILGLGEALLAQGKAGEAQAQFERLRKEPFQGRWEADGIGGVGWCYLAGKRYEEAGRLFFQAARFGSGRAARRAHVGYARSLIGQGRHADAIQYLQERFFSASEPRFDRIEAQARLAGGDAYRARGGREDLWEAVYQYLWVPAVYGAFRAEEAEALRKAGDLLKKLGAEEDAARVLGRLREKVPTSRPGARK